MKRAERLHAISQRLRSVRPAVISASTLAAEFGVSRRTIERDLESLRNAGVPLFGQHGRSGGAGSIERSGARTLLLDDAQIAGLLIALRHSGQGSVPYASAASSAIGAMTEALDPGVRNAVELLAERVRVAPSDSAVNRRVRSVIEDAVRDQVVVNLRYVDRNGVATRRAVDPVAFLGVGADWSLIGWCHTRQAGRLFRLERIQSANLTRRPAVAHDVDEALGWVPYDVGPLST